jgi:hypothetical protein
LSPHAAPRVQSLRTNSGAGRFGRLLATVSTRRRAPAPKRARGGNWRRPRFKIQVGATVGVIATVITTSLLVYDRFQDGCQESPGATLGVPRAEHALFGNYLDAAAIDPAGYTERQLRIPGTIIRFQDDIRGLKNEEVAVYWSLFEWHTKLPKRLNQLVFERTLSDCHASIQRPIWIPALPANGPVYAEIVLKHGDDELASNRSERFTQAHVG